MSRNKLISIVCTLALLVGFFCVDNNVNAENTYIRNIRTYSGYKSSASLTYSATACQFHYNSDTSLTGGIYSPVLITVRFTNNGSNDVKIANSYVDLTFTNTAEVQRYDCYTSDLMIQVAGTAGQHTPRYNIIGGDGFSYNGHIVVPHNSSIYLVFEVDIAGSLNTSSGQPEGPGLDAVFVSVADADVQTGEFVSGIIPRQLDSIETLIGTIAGYVYGDNQNLVNLMQQVGSIKNLLNDIKNQIQFTGTYVIPTQNGYQSRSYDLTESLGSFDIQTSLNKYGSRIVEDEFEIVNGNTSYHSGSKLIYLYGRIRIRNYNSNKNAVLALNAQRLSMDFNLPVSAGYSYEFILNDNDIFSDVYSYVSSNKLRLAFVYKIFDKTNINNSVIPHGYHEVIFLIKCYVPIDADITVNDSFMSYATTYTFELSDIAYPNDIYFSLNDIRDYFIGESDQNEDIADASDDSAELSDQIHQQEETWYDENSAAMEAVGLSSYRFTNQQASGILGVTTQFEQLWLALGNWTLVYIFVLMASLATFILRHEPSTRVKQMRDMYMTDRAVARDWEMRTNPEKFSHRRWVENNRRH